MKKTTYLTLAAILVISVIIPVNASSSTTTVTVDDALFITYSFENLNSTIYDQIKTNTQFSISTIPQTIKQNMEQANQKLVNWWLAPQADIYDDASNAIHISFFLGGSDIISFKTNGTTMKRTYRVNTEWRKIQVSLTNNLTMDFAQYLENQVVDWQRPNATSFNYENKETGTLDVAFSLALPPLASDVQVQGDTISYNMPPRIEDQLLNSPFLILGAIAVTLAIALIYRKTR